MSVTPNLMRRDRCAWLALGDCLLRVLACLLLATCAHTTVEAADFKTFSGPGFEIDHPAGWQVEHDAARGSIVLDGPAYERVTLWPIYVRSQLEPELAKRILSQLAERSTLAFTWEPAPGIAASTVRLVGHDEADRAAVASLSWVNSPSGAAGCFACFSAPAATFAAAEEKFAEVLASLRLHGPSATRHDTALEFVRWSDPHEGAFEVDVPEGWQVRGGLARFTAIDTRPTVEVQSPNGRVLAYLGDAQTPTYVVPSPTLEQAGFAEGSWYAPGQGITMQVKHYMPGGQFARWFASTTLAKGRADLRFEAVRGRPDADRELSTVYRRWSAPVVEQALNAGEALFTCRDADGPLVGYAFAATLETADPRGIAHRWIVERNFGYLAARDHAPEAAAVLARLVSSFRLNPDWVAKQSHLTGKASEIAAQSGERISRLIGETSESGTTAREVRPQQPSNIVLEIADAIDPATGEAYRVESGDGYFWIDPRGNIVGTEKYSAAIVNYRELVRLP